MEQLTSQICEYLSRNIPFALATILTHKGSTPRTSGSRMLVLADQTIHGTIGGGQVEAKVIQACARMIQAPENRIMEFTLDQTLAQGLDMICGGNLTVWIQVLDNQSDPELLPVYQALAQQEKKGKKAVLVSQVKEGSTQAAFSTQKCLALPDGTLQGPPIIPKPLFDAIGENRFSSSAPVIWHHGLTEYIVEPALPRDTVHIFGAGHVGLQLAKMAHLTDFRVVVVDDRQEFANGERFPNAHQVLAVEKFPQAFERLSIDANAYIVILTRGHLHDQTVLEQALKTPAAYIGMIGSRQKRDQIYSNLIQKGISQDALDRVYSPIGIKIRSETPAEIAVSIIAQIIQVRARNS